MATKQNRMGWTKAPLQNLIVTWKGCNLEEIGLLTSVWIYATIRGISPDIESAEEIADLINEDLEMIQRIMKNKTVIKGLKLTMEIMEDTNISTEQYKAQQSEYGKTGGRPRNENHHDVPKRKVRT